MSYLYSTNASAWFSLHSPVDSPTVHQMVELCRDDGRRDLRRDMKMRDEVCGHKEMVWT